MSKKVFEFMDDERKDFFKIKHDEAKRFINPKTGLVFDEMVERVKCPVCDVDDSEVVFKKAGFHFNKCNVCGLLHVNPQLTEETQQAIYKNSKTADYWIRLQSKTSEKTWNAKVKYQPALDELERLYPKGEEEFKIPENMRETFERMISQHKMGYKLISIATKVE